MNDELISDKSDESDARRTFRGLLLFLLMLSLIFYSPVE